MIRRAVSADGAACYLIDAMPSELPAVRGRDLAAAWEAVGKAGNARRPPAAPAFSFRSPQGCRTQLVLNDADAQCWAGALDAILDMQTSYGMSVCLRLLALVGLVAGARWAAALVVPGRHGPEIHPNLLKLAAESQLTETASLYEPMLRAHLQGLVA